MSHSQELNQLYSGWVREIKAGDYIERRICSKRPKGGCSISWEYDTYIDQLGVERVERTGKYLVNATGEIKESEANAKQRIDNMRQVRVACERFKWKLRANASEARNFITLTYAENMTDTARLYTDFKKFWQRYKRIYECTGYLLACEPQERGAWHIHLVTIGGERCDTEQQLAQASALTAQIWGHGMVQVELCRNIADIGSYLTSYLVNLTPSADDSEETKASKKGARLCLYPARFRFLRWSRGLKDPEVYENPEQRETADPEKKGYEKIKDRTYQISYDPEKPPILTRVIVYCKTEIVKKYKKAKKIENSP